MFWILLHISGCQVEQGFILVNAIRIDGFDGFLEGDAANLDVIERLAANLEMFHQHLEVFSSISHSFAG